MVYTQHKCSVLCAQKNDMYKIGEFSKLSRVPVKTLRYYHQIGLFQPEKVDDFTGYRYYTAAQLAHLHQILELKGWGFSLEEIGRLRQHPLTPAVLHDLLQGKREELTAQIAAEQAHLAQLNTRLQQLKQEILMPTYDVTIKEVAPYQVAGLREVVANYDSVGPLYQELFGTLTQQGVAPAGPAMGIFYDEEYMERDVDVEIATPVVEGTLPADSRVKLHTLPAVQVAAVVHQGPYEPAGFEAAYQALMDWIAGNGYHIIGPNREIYLRGPETGVPPEEFLTEMQFPVVQK